MEEACHTVYERECQVSYRPSVSKVKVRVCPGRDDEMAGDGDHAGEDENELHNSVVIDIRPTPAPAGGETRSDCVGGVRRVSPWGPKPARP